MRTPTIPPIEVRLLPQKIPKPAAITFWFKYLLTIYVASSTLFSALNGGLKVHEVQNAGIVIGIWTANPKKEKRTKNEK